MTALPDIETFIPMYRGRGDYEAMCFTVAELEALGIPERRWWTLIFCDEHDAACPVASCEDDDDAACDAAMEGCECHHALWSHGYHFVNRGNSPRSYIYTEVEPPAEVVEAEAYIH